MDNATCTVEVPMADGARIAAFVYAPKGVSDEPGTPFAVTWQPAPVVVLHGNGESHEHMAEVVGRLRGERSVIAIDSRGQGASTRGTEPVSYERLASDVLEVMSRLGVTQAHLVGFSDGGITALLIARDTPSRVLSLTVLGANLTPEGLTRGALYGMRARLAELEAGDAACAANPEQGLYNEAELLRLMLEQPDIDPKSLASVRCPTCVMAGSRDLIRPEETSRIAESIVSSELAVVTGASHDLPLEAPASVASHALETMAKGERPVLARPLVSVRAGVTEVNEVGNPDIVVVPATPEQEAGVLALYDRLMDSCDEPGRETCGWRRGFWPLPHDVSRRLHEGATWVAVRAADIADARPRPGAPILGAMSLDGDFGLPGVTPDWEQLDKHEVLTCHLLATDPYERGQGIASSLLQAYAREALRRGCKALRINTSPQSLSNRLYHELGFTLHRPLWFPYEGLPLTPWTNVYELRLER